MTARPEASWPAGAGRTTSLWDVLAARGTLPPAAAAMVASQVCVALASAHARGLAYGRLTPANVLLCAEGRVKLHDFWMAQAARRSTAADLQADLQALGRCMKVMLTGREPAAGEPVALGPEVPPELAAIVARAVRGGYRSVGDLGRDLVRFLATVRPGLALAGPRRAAWPVRAAPAPRPVAGRSRPSRRARADRAQPPTRRRRRLALLAGLVGAWVAVVAVVAVGLPRGRQGRPAGPVEVPATPTSALLVPTTGAAPAGTAAPADPAPAATAPATTAPAATVPHATSYDDGRVGVGERRVVPDVVGLEPRKAAEVLGKARLRARFVQVRTRWRGDYQLVVAQDPPGGTAVLVGSVVTLGLPGGRGHG